MTEGFTARTVVPAESDATVFEGDESVVGDGNAMGVAAEVTQHLLGAGEGRRQDESDCDA